MFEYIKFWYYRKTHDGSPHPVEALRASNSLDPDVIYLEGSTRNRAYQMAYYYGHGWGYEDIAKTYNVTRERVRQCVAKVVREYYASN